MITDHVLIIGGGYLATRLHEYFIGGGHTVALLDYPSIDITDLESLHRVISRERPTLIINAAAHTDTAAAEKSENQAKVFALNVAGPITISQVARQHSIRWVHFSTGMMFDGPGPDGQGFRETDTPEPTNYYSWTKAWADGALTPFLERDRILIMRIHTPISRFSHPRNFLDRMQRFDKAINVESSVTIVEDMLNALDHLLATEQYGLFNVVNPGSISAYDIALLMQKQGLIPADKQLVPMTRTELDALGGAHQTFPILNTDKLLASGLDLPPISEAVMASIQAFKKSA
jgi:dTDP-4-dehydrorhamnose reductase